MSVWRWETEKIKKIVLKIKKIDDMRYTLQPSDGENPNPKSASILICNRKGIIIQAKFKCANGDGFL